MVIKAVVDRIEDDNIFLRSEEEIGVEICISADSMNETCVKGEEISLTIPLPSSRP